MATAICGKFPVVLRAVFELRYRFGFTYLDRCGRTVNAIQRSHPDWVLANQDPNPQNAPLVNVKTGTRFNFSTTRLDLLLEKGAAEASLTDDQLREFTAQVDHLASITIDQLSLEEFSRIGCRIWYLFPFDDERSAERWLLDLKCYSFAPTLAKAFDGTVEASSAAVVITCSDRKFRIGFDTVVRTIPIEVGGQVLNLPPHRLPSGKGESGKSIRLEALVEQSRLRRAREHNPPYAASIDVDVSQEEPEVVRGGEFVGSALEQARVRLEQAIPARS